MRFASATITAASSTCILPSFASSWEASVEQFFEKGFSAFVGFVAPRLGTLGAISGLSRLRRRSRGRSRRRLSAAFENFIEFAPVQPNATALRAIIDFDPLALAHHQCDFANGARHSGGGICHGHSLGRMDIGTDRPVPLQIVHCCCCSICMKAFATDGRQGASMPSHCASRVSGSASAPSGNRK